MPKKSAQIATSITAAMATWTFIFVFLASCGLEIYLNRVGVWGFDRSTWILNLGLSLIAAIQGSIIMISQKLVESRSNQRAQETHDAVMAELQEIKEIHRLLKERIAPPRR